MDSRELTKKFYELENKIIDCVNQIKYMEQVLEKQSLLINDMKTSVEMLERERTWPR